jgi:hypothetical protein
VQERIFPFLRAEFVVQRYEPRFGTEREVRLYFCRGKFLYAVAHVGWIGANDWPSPVPRSEIRPELSASERIFACMPRLRALYLLRLDFGPRGHGLDTPSAFAPSTHLPAGSAEDTTTFTARLNEIELFPDLFGGPRGDLGGAAWRAVRRQIAEHIVEELGAVILEHGATPVRELPEAKLNSEDLRGHARPSLRWFKGLIDPGYLPLPMADISPTRNLGGVQPTAVLPPYKELDEGVIGVTRPAADDEVKASKSPMAFGSLRRGCDLRSQNDAGGYSSNSHPRRSGDELCSTPTEGQSPHQRHVRRRAARLTRLRARHADVYTCAEANNFGFADDEMGTATTKSSVAFDVAEAVPDDVSAFKCRDESVAKLYAEAAAAVASAVQVMDVEQLGQLRILDPEREDRIRALR